MFTGKMNFYFHYLLLAMAMIISHSNATYNKKPHIIFVMADDLGWNDVGFRNRDIKTPCIDRAARSGIILNASYVQPVCTPSRAALMTGYFPYRSGMQVSVVPLFGPFGLPLQFKLLPEIMKDNGYNTHLIGKWHLGSCNERYHPLKRGFDSFFGFLGGGLHFYTHSYPLTNDNRAISMPGLQEVYDFWNQTTPSVHANGTYSSFELDRQLRHILGSREDDNPLYIHLAMQTTHCPIEVPEKQIRRYPPMNNQFRRHYSALVSQMDSDFGQLIRQLKAHNIYDNSIIIFTTDNGGDYKSGGNNYPLRGNKATLYEGGTRATSFIHSPLLTKTGYTYNGMMHVADWFPTIVKLAGGTPDKNIDGIDMWHAITNNKKSPRTSFVYNLVDANGKLQGAIREDDWKLIFGDAGLPNTIIKPNDVTGELFNACGGFFSPNPNSLPFQLYNLKDDPTESNNLAQKNRSKVNSLFTKAKKYRLKMVKPVFLTNNVSLYRNRTRNLSILNTNWCGYIQDVTPA